VQSNMMKNSRTPHAVSKWAGTQTSAESWGTGRAVARIPRVPGGGTHRAGQGAFGNMCRGGRMFSPTRTYRRWHRKININQKRFAVASAIAASAIPALVLARGHQISNIPEVPLVLSSEAVEKLEKTKAAIALLNKFHIKEELERCQKVTKRTGKSRLRNRRKKVKLGPLIISGDKKSTAYRAFRNLPGVQTSSVFNLNLLRLAPGGQLGRFIIWTREAFEQLNSIFGTFDKSSDSKKGYFLPRPVMTVPDVGRVIASEPIQLLMKKKKKSIPVQVVKRTNIRKGLSLLRVNPYEAARRVQQSERKKNPGQAAKEEKGKHVAKK